MKGISTDVYEDGLTYHTVAVIAVPADGPMQFAKILYFFPSKPSVFVKPIIAAFAVPYCEVAIRD